jgi:hypothetical protein
MPKFLGHDAKYFSHYYYGTDTLNFQTGAKKAAGFLENLCGSCCGGIRFSFS